MSRHGTERSLPRSRAMPLMMMCIVCLFVVYIYVLNSSIAAMKDGSDVYRTISQDQWIYQVERYKDFSSIRRGIIVCVFDAMIPMAASLVLELRALGNTELIQMYHCNGELSAASYRILYMIDAHLEIVDVCKDFVASGRLSTSKVSDFRSFWLKPLALVHTRLVEVILLDADDLLFHDPSQLWQVPGYKKTGTIFFFDREVAKAEYLNSRSIHRFQRMQNLHALIETFDYARFGLVKQPSEYLQSTLAWNGHSAHEQDSSIVVINKAIAPLAIDVLLHLVLVTRYQLEFSYGDKELFWLAFELAHVPYSFSPWANTAAAMPGDMAQHPDTICGGLAQWMPLADAKSVLLHINGGYIFNPYIDHDVHSMQDAAGRTHQLLAAIPSHVSRQRKRSKPLTTPEDKANPDGYWPQECLYKRGSEAMRPQDVASIQRRVHSAVRIASLHQRELALDKKSDTARRQRRLGNADNGAQEGVSPHPSALVSRKRQTSLS
ncbi:hypothetical protein, variant 4 [Aphanomyces invadans]|uniref:Nucleotide-diphospho-sugar transferase domain-containing protein n=1 Tax=Aphanomyces invadans TaxID=157072 RepID=A0A024TEU1_9STRA|nr:hypothetical protein, variant 4 [Aphanomyces invadans]XP_008879279.1 hypothetical protein, variant 3 [Aphanomyces invadans]XP_008879281.1 hypothetical protein, variant 2 [Aphanomyces invadans]ETV92109.1 hypothetical protein, variant 2 [Aphanomyces invadans]ETV92110.1 hypothetical protein, variant 3 [Aphanomyces invadans]ETV92111.1 hypothetical protein, variant 4 [Aphanomyces invadans]|eukprot:XP_008879270.1 hypothetical protein, variant 4 [Aphanomyces invadans]